MRAFNETVVAEFRSNGGAVGGRLAGQPLVLLTTVGVRVNLNSADGPGAWSQVVYRLVL